MEEKEEKNFLKVNESLSQKLKGMSDEEFANAFTEGKFTPDEMELLNDCHNRLPEYVAYWLRSTPMNQMHLIRLIMQNTCEMFVMLDKAAHGVACKSENIK